MNRWYGAAVVVIAASLLAAGALPPIEGCTAWPGSDPGLNECGGLQIAPALVVLVGSVIATALGVAGFLRSTGLSRGRA